MGDFNDFIYDDDNWFVKLIKMLIQKRRSKR